jgi:hypothetical protein
MEGSRLVVVAPIQSFLGMAIISTGAVRAHPFSVSTL